LSGFEIHDVAADRAAAQRKRGILGLRENGQADPEPAIGDSRGIAASLLFNLDDVPCVPAALAKTPIPLVSMMKDSAPDPAAMIKR
jgi:hypothetical protein